MGEENTFLEQSPKKLGSAAPRQYSDCISSAALSQPPPLLWASPARPNRARGNIAHSCRTYLISFYCSFSRSWASKGGRNSLATSRESHGAPVIADACWLRRAPLTALEPELFYDHFPPRTCLLPPTHESGVRSSRPPARRSACRERVSGPRTFVAGSNEAGREKFYSL